MKVELVNDKIDKVSLTVQCNHKKSDLLKSRECRKLFSAFPAGIYSLNSSDPINNLDFVLNFYWH